MMRDIAYAFNQRRFHDLLSHSGGLGEGWAKGVSQWMANHPFRGIFRAIPRFQHVPMLERMFVPTGQAGSPLNYCCFIP